MRGAGKEKETAWAIRLDMYEYGSDDLTSSYFHAFRNVPQFLSVHRAMTFPTEEAARQFIKRHVQLKRMRLKIVKVRKKITRWAEVEE